MSTIVVHHLSNSRSLRILWLLEELGLPYEAVIHPRDPQTQRAPASLAGVHPLGKGPVLQHGGHTLAESGAIIEYVTRHLAGGRLSVDPDSPDFPDYETWLHFAEGSAMGPLVFDLIYEWTGAGNADLKGFYDAEIERHQRYMEVALADREYFVRCGFTAADVQMGFLLEFAAVRGRLRGCPRLTAYLARLQARPAYRRAVVRGGPYDLSVFAAR